mmetsp:Transcript_13769/g.32382  ORF Transcript_13769/g.32382 Transcript_13769/m.32382 type:complete len:215 (-) Transcript_13769:625-1269(-)
MCCLSLGSHLDIVLSTHPGTAFVTMHTTPSTIATFKTSMTALCSASIASVIAGSSGRGCPNQAGISESQSVVVCRRGLSAPRAISWSSSTLSFKRLLIQVVGHSVLSQSNTITVRRCGKAAGSGRRNETGRLASGGEEDRDGGPLASASLSILSMSTTADCWCSSAYPDMPCLLPLRWFCPSSRTATGGLGRSVRGATWRRFPNELVARTPAFA